MSEVSKMVLSQKRNLYSGSTNNLHEYLDLRKVSLRRVPRF